MATKAKKTTRKATRKATKKKVTRKKVTKKRTVRKAATKRKTAKKRTVKRKTTKKKTTKRKTVKKTTKRKPAKRKVAKKKPVRKVAKRKPVRKKAPVKKAPAKKTATPKRKKRPAGPLFDRILPSRPPEPATGDNPYNIKIVNMVASANFNVELDLFALARDVDTIEYEPEKFPGAILKLTKEGMGVKASLLLFKNGKVICTGARSEDEVEQALMKTSVIIADFVS